MLSNRRIRYDCAKSPAHCAFVLFVATASGRSTRLSLQFGSFAFWNGHYSVIESWHLLEKQTFCGRIVFGLEVFQILLVCLVLRCLLVLGQTRIILLFRTVGLAFTRFAFICWQDLPSFTNDLSYFSEGQVLSFQKLSDFCKRSVVNYVRLHERLRLEKMT